MKEIDAVIQSIQALDETIMNQTQQHLDSLTKPRGSLSVLERMACQLAGVQRMPHAVQLGEQVVEGRRGAHPAAAIAGT